MQISSKIALSLRPVIQAVADIPLTLVVVGMLMLGVILTMSGLYVEDHYVLMQIKTGGKAALDAYNEVVRSARYEPGLEYFIHGIKLELPTAGANLQVIGMAVAYVGGGLTTVTVLLARHIVSPVYELRMQKLGYQAAS